MACLADVGLLPSAAWLTAGPASGHSEATVGRFKLILYIDYPSDSYMILGIVFGALCVPVSLYVCAYVYVCLR